MWKNEETYTYVDINMWVCGKRKWKSRAVRTYPLQYLYAVVCMCVCARVWVRGKLRLREKQKNMGLLYHTIKLMNLFIHFCKFMHFYYGIREIKQQQLDEALTPDAITMKKLGFDFNLRVWKALEKIEK